MPIDPANATDEDGDELTVTVGGLPGGLTYQDGQITGTPTGAGEYEITVAYSDGSEPVTDTFMLTVQAGGTSTILASAPAVRDLIKVYPNPASSHLTIELNGPARGYDLTVAGLTGNTVLAIGDLGGLMNGNRLTFPVSRLRPGIYFLRFTGKGTSLPTVRKIQVKRC